MESETVEKAVKAAVEYIHRTHETNTIYAMSYFIGYIEGATQTTVLKHIQEAIDYETEAQRAERKSQERREAKTIDP